MKARRVILIILSLIYLGALLVFGYSPLVSVVSRVVGQAAPAVTAGTNAEQTTPMPTIAPLITPKVNLSAGSFEADTQQLTTVLAAGETALLDSFTQLRSADLSGSANVEEIAAWAAQHPDVDVTYTVTLPNGTSVSSKATSVDLSGVDTARIPQLLATLPQASDIRLGSLGEGGLTAETVEGLRQTFPGRNFNYTLQVMGQTVGPDLDVLDLSAAAPEEIAAVIPVLSSLPRLNRIYLGAEGSSNVSWDDIDRISQACPNATLDFGFTIWGQPANLADSDLNLTHIKMNDEGAAVYNVLPLMHNCTYVDMDSCGVSNDAMCRIRDANPGVKVVWRVWFGSNYSVRTDVIKILASKPSQGGMITNRDVPALSCCTSIKYIDLGHNSDLSDCSFVSSMPDLEVAIFALTNISDISPLADCPHLEYLEVQHTPTSDLSALQNAFELRHLNIGDTNVADISPLYGLTELERLYICAGSRVPAEQAEEMQRIAPQCEINTTQNREKPDEGQWRYSDHVPAEAYVQFEQNGWVGFPFVNQDRYELLREQFGYANAEYAFSWLDPLY